MGAGVDPNAEEADLPGVKSEDVADVKEEEEDLKDNSADEDLENVEKEAEEAQPVEDLLPEVVLKEEEDSSPDAGKIIGESDKVERKEGEKEHPDESGGWETKKDEEDEG